MRPDMVYSPQPQHYQQPSLCDVCVNKWLRQNLNANDCFFENKFPLLIGTQLPEIMSCYVQSFQGTSPVTNNKWLISFCLSDWTAASWMQMQMCFRFLPELMLGLTFRRLERDQKTRQLQSGVWGCKQPVWRCHLIALLWHHKGVFLCKKSRGRLVNVFPYAD